MSYKQHGWRHGPAGTDPIVGLKHGAYSFNPATIPAAGPTSLAWEWFLGDELLDISTPQLPKVIVAARYAVTVSVNPHNPVSGTEYPDGLSFNTTLYVGNVGAVEETWQIGTAVDASVSLSLTWSCVAGDAIYVLVNNRDSVDHTFSAEMNVQQLF